MTTRSCNLRTDLRKGIESWFTNLVSDFLCERRNKPNRKTGSSESGPQNLNFEGGVVGFLA